MEIAYFSDVRLSERLTELFGVDDSTPNLLEEVPATFKKERMFTYHLVPRLNKFEDYEILRAFGNAFTLVYPFVAELRPTRWWLEDDFVFRDLPAAASSLPSGSVIAYSLVYDEFVERRVRDKKAKAEKRLFDARRG